VEKNCTEMYIGVMIRSYGVTSNGQRTYSTTRGSASYNLGLDINANIPNKRPVIMDAKVEPTRGDSNDIFRFSVVYKDPQNETAKHVELWLDGEFFKELSPVSLLTYNYTVGVEYFIEVPGRQIGTDAFHNFNISASDGKEWAIKKESGSRKISGPIVDDNIAPQSDWGDAFIVALVEDTDVTWLVLDDLFSDPNSIEPSFTYLILDERGEWDDRNYEDENLTVEIVNNGTVGVPEFRLKIMPEPNVNGVFTVRINASDGEFFEKFAELDIVIEIAPVNDPPEMRSIGSSSLQEWDEQFMYDVEQEEMVEVRVRAQDMDGDELEFSWDIGDVLTSPMEGVNYGFNSSSGDLWFIPGDGDVPGFETVVTVTD
ncbi:MAG: hypothetical protein U9R75_02525, partial [Candidatus Thermoplasmatota archaeon]|nr:hypothetical protein [Candidatus Thermoplasmatota archaeon]